MISDIILFRRVRFEQKEKTTEVKMPSHRRIPKKTVYRRGPYPLVQVVDRHGHIRWSQLGKFLDSIGPYLKHL
jgi:hypothetical protein